MRNLGMFAVGIVLHRFADLLHKVLISTPQQSLFGAEVP
jgi:hypothetical protein